MEGLGVEAAGAGTWEDVVYVGMRTASVERLKDSDRGGGRLSPHFLLPSASGLIIQDFAGEDDRIVLCFAPHPFMIRLMPMPIPIPMTLQHPGRAVKSTPGKHS